MIYQDDIKLLEYIENKLDKDASLDVKEWIEENAENQAYYEQFRRNYFFMRWGMRGRCVKGKFELIEGKLRRRRLIRKVITFSAVAAILIVIGIGLEFFYVPQEIGLAQGGNSIIYPGGARAMLQLSSGEVVPISTKKKMLKEKNGTSIEINNKGEVSYKENKTGKDEIQKEVYNKLLIPRGGEFVVTLDDGTRVWLNSATEFSYPVNFISERRTVYLKGEAFFEVSCDTTRPFVVFADGCSVKVYGTQFNVNTHKDGVVQTVLVSGSVACQGGRSEVLLKPGERAVYQKEAESIAVEQVNVNPYIAWKDGTFIFENESLENIMEILSLWYDIDVFYAYPEARNVRLTGDMKRYKEIQELLYFFEQISDVKFVIKGKAITVKSK